MQEIKKNWSAYQAHAEFCKIFGHPIRLAILDSLRNGEKTVTKLETELRISQSNVSQQLSSLRRLGVVQSKRRGREVCYRLSDRRLLRAYDLVDEIIRDTRLLEAETLA
jgi:ArsR family transcriptional regulator, virulence genes transcriptional regulator